MVGSKLFCKGVSVAQDNGKRDLLGRLFLHEHYKISGDGALGSSACCLPRGEKCEGWCFSRGSFFLQSCLVISSEKSLCFWRSRHLLLLPPPPP